MFCWKMITPIAFSVALLAPISAIAQQPRPQPTSQRRGTTPVTPNSNGKTPQRQPCWKQAGIPRNVIMQRRTIAENMHSQIVAVCNDSSLNDKQKIQKIREIRQSSQQQIKALLSPSQWDALKQCQTSRRSGLSHAGGHPGNRPHPDSGPCANMH